MTNEQVYDQEIAPLVKQIVDICRKYSIPMIAGFQYDESGICVSVNIPDNLESNSIVDRKGELQWPFISFLGKVVKQQRRA